MPNVDLSRFLPHSDGTSPSGEEMAPLPPASNRPSIRVAAFNLGYFDEAKLSNTRSREIIAQVLSRFDLVALQGLRASHHGILVQLLEQLNAASRDYDFAVSTELGLQGPESYTAFVFDRTSIEVDRNRVRTVEDRSGRLHHRPLTGLFRARGPNPRAAFTFAAVAVQIDEEHAADEVNLLGDIYRAVRSDFRDEDDVLLLGTLQADSGRLAELERQFGLVGPNLATPTTTRGTQVADYILFPRRATVEFTGRSGVVDLMREFGLSMPEALQVSEHLPVWAEFSVYEGGLPGRVASGSERLER